MIMIDHIHDPLAQKFTFDMREASALTKTACDDLANEDLSSLPDSAFACCVEFGDRYYPCHTPEHAALSRVYLHGHPPKGESFSKIAAYLEDVAAAFGLPPWNPIKQAAESVDETQKLAEDMMDFEKNYKRMFIESRRSAALNLRERAESLNKTASLPFIVQRYAGRFLRPDFMNAIADRQDYFPSGSPERVLLLNIGMKADDAADLVSRLRQFDENNGLTAHYDGDLLDPCLGLLGDEPPPPKSIFREGDCELFENDLALENLKSKLKDLVSDKIIQALNLDFADAIEKVKPELKVVILKAVTQ